MLFRSVEITVEKGREVVGDLLGRDVSAPNRRIPLASVLSVLDVEIVGATADTDLSGIVVEPMDPKGRGTKVEVVAGAGVGIDAATAAAPKEVVSGKDK